jgi:hypothetical protein
LDSSRPLCVRSTDAAHIRRAIMTLPGFRAELPHGLAALRIAVGVAVLISPELWHAPYFAAQPEALRFAPEGLGWIVEHVPIRVELAYAAQGMLIACCAAAIIGVAAQPAMLGVTLSGLYVFGLSQLSGAVINDMHLFWLSTLLAVSPCGDALSIWRRARGRPQPTAARSLAYGVPLQLSRVLLGIVYFFPGFWKLATSGLAWITSDNLRNQLYWKWYQLGREPPALRLDHVPYVLQVAALAVVVFELGFLALIWFPRGRVIAALGGLAFHLGTQWLMGITFLSLLACYVVLLPWERISRSRSPQPLVSERSRAAKRRVTLPAIVGATLVMITFVQGARGAVQAWPFGCYPTFDRMLGDTIGDLRIEAVRADGSTTVIPDGPSTRGGSRSSQGWARAWQLAGMYGTPPDRARLRAYWQSLRREPRAAAAARDAVRLRFYAATYSVLPERTGQPPIAKHYLGELPLPE